MSPFAAISLLAFFVAVFLSFFAYGRNPSSHTNRIFALLAIVLAYGAFTEFGYRQADTLAQAELWWKISVFWPVGVSLLLHYTLLYTKHTKLMSSYGHLLIYGPALLFSILDLTTNLVTGQLREEYWGWTATITYNWISYLLVLWIAIILFASLYLVWNYYRNRVTSTERKQALSVALGISIPIITAILVDGLLPEFGIVIPELTSTGFVLGSVFVFIGIYEYELFYHMPFTVNTIMRSLSDMLFVLDKNGQIVTTSQSSIEQTGFNENEVLGQKLDEFITMGSDSQPSSSGIETISHLTEDSSIKDVQCYLKRDSGQPLPVSLTVTPITNNTRIFGFLAMAHDVSTRMNFEAQLQNALETEKTLKQNLQNEIDKRTDYTRALVHELKTPLTSIVLASGLLATDSPDYNNPRLVSNIRESAKKLNDRIGELLDLAQDELGILSIEKEETDVSALIHNICDTFVLMAPPNSIKFDMEFASDIPLVVIDGKRMEQVIQNLLSNAFKFTPENGAISITLDKESDDIVVKVKDTGPGIPEKERGRIFQRYYIHNKDSLKLSGMGLGLALCKILVEKHGGKIWVESAEGEGSTFIFTIPTNGRNA